LGEKYSVLRYFPAYGCVLLAKIAMIDQVYIELIGLDSWNFEIKNGTHDSYSHHSDAKSAFHAQFDVTSLNKVISNFNGEFAKGVARTQDKRSAINESSHQKTPSWIACNIILISTMEICCSPRYWKWWFFYS
jgi:hypothetical protein